MMRFRLPRGVALVRVETPMGLILVVSTHLSKCEEIAAMTVAAYRAFHGEKAVLIQELEIAVVASEVEHHVKAA